MNLTKTGNLMKSFTFLDRDQIEFRGESKDIFVGVQPHHRLGHLHSSIGTKDDSSEMILHKPGDRFYVRDKNLFLKYSFRGGAVVDVWMIPTGICHGRNVYSTQQRSAQIRLSDQFKDDRKICWFLKFRRNVTYHIDFKSSLNTSTVFITDEKMNEDEVSIIRSGRIADGSLSNMHVVVLHAKAQDEIDLTVNINSTVPFADWTDSPSYFVRRNKLGMKVKANCYLETDRSVATWIWLTVVSIFAGIFGFTLIIFFVRPIHKIGRSISQSDDLSKIKKKKH